MPSVARQRPQGMAADVGSGARQARAPRGRAVRRHHRVAGRNRSRDLCGDSRPGRLRQGVRGHSRRRGAWSRRPASESPCSARTSGNCRHSSIWPRTWALAQVSFLAVDVANPHAFGRTDDFVSDLALRPEDLPALERILDSMERDHAEDFRSGFIAESPAEAAAHPAVLRRRSAAREPTRRCAAMHRSSRPSSARPAACSRAFSSQGRSDARISATASGFGGDLGRC